MKCKVRKRRRRRKGREGERAEDTGAGGVGRGGVGAWSSRVSDPKTRCLCALEGRCCRFPVAWGSSAAGLS